MRVSVELVSLLVLGAALLLLPVHNQARAPHPYPASSPNVILITVDTLRADHLSCYGDTQIQTPNIDSVANEGTRFLNAYTPVPITLPAHSAIHTGTYPMENGMRDFSGNKLPEAIPTLATVLRKHGYSTAAFIGAAVLDGRFGLNQGFGTYVDNFDFNSNADLQVMRRSADKVIDGALAWLKNNPKQPLLLWVHLYDPHFPYEPPAPFAKQYSRNPYDGSIAFVDSQIGRLLGYLRERNLYKDCLVVLCSDHGEGLGEHGEKTHGFFMYNSTLHVPLIVKSAGSAAGTVAEEVSLVDIMPTILNALGIPVPDTVQGRSLLPLIAGRAAGEPPQIYAETYLPFLHFGWGILQGLESHGWKYISAPHPEIFDLERDPHETHNLFKTQQSHAQQMKNELDDVLRRFTPQNALGARSKTSTDPAVAEGLQSLGYVAFAGARLPGATNQNLPDPKERIRVYEAIIDAGYAGDHGQFNESIRMLRGAEKVEGNSPAIQYLIALNHYRLQEYPDAAEGFEKVMAAQPENALAADYLGLAQAKSGDEKGAVKSFERALKLDPANYTVASNLGTLYLKWGRIQDAKVEFESAVRANPQYAPGYEILGEIAMAEGDQKRAIENLEKAVRFDPSSVKARKSLGRAYLAVGRTTEAQQQFKKAESN